MSLSYITLPPAKITHVGLPDPKDLPEDSIVQFQDKNYRVSNMELVEIVEAADGVKVSSDILSTLQSIGSDETPVPVHAKIKSGDYAIKSLGSPSTDVTNKTIYSNAFTVSGEKIAVSLMAYAPSGATIGTDGAIWLECDITGGTSFKPILESVRKFSDIPAVMAWNRNLVTEWPCKSGNYRIAINIGTKTGSGVFGWNISVLD